uniref:transmembrane protein 229A isoform X2 n=1 Tax=Myxine glutinosa TaxID=7769 RepID=UPI00358DEB88
MEEVYGGTSNGSLLHHPQLPEIMVRLVEAEDRTLKANGPWSTEGLRQRHRLSDIKALPCENAHGTRTKDCSTAGSPLNERSQGELAALPLRHRLYWYAMQGTTIDVLLSAAEHFRYTGDRRLLGFSSPYLALCHAFIGFTLEKTYLLQRRLFPGSPFWSKFVLFALVFAVSRVSLCKLPPGRLSHGVERPSGPSVPLCLALALFHSFFLDRFLRLRLVRDAPGCEPRRSALRYARGSVPQHLHLLFFGAHGLMDEVFFTAFFNLFEKGEWTLAGHTSLWSFAMYGSCSMVIERLYVELAAQRGWSLQRRLPVYIACVYMWELSCGLVLRSFGACSWDYSHYPLNFQGLITLMYFPGWLALSLYQDLLSDVLLRLRNMEEAAMVY